MAPPTASHAQRRGAGRRRTEGPPAKDRAARAIAKRKAIANGVAKWRQGALDGTDSLKRNTVKAIARAERKLRNSMAHVARPRPADFERWRAMEAHIDALKASLAKMGGATPERPPEAPPLNRPEGLPRARYRNTASGGGDATS